MRQDETFLTHLSGLTRNAQAVPYAAANNADLIDVNALLCSPTPPGKLAGLPPLVTADQGGGRQRATPSLLLHTGRSVKIFRARKLEKNI